MASITEQSIQDGWKRIRRAESSRDQAEKSIDADHIKHPGNTITVCQRAIEHSVKATFILANVSFSTSHGIDPQSQDATNLLNGLSEEMPNRFPLSKTVRLLTLSCLWASTYPTSEQGIRTAKVTVEPDDIFTVQDTETAFEYADEAVTLGKQHLHYANEVVN